MTDPLISIETLAAPLDAKPKPVVRCSFLPTIDKCRGALNASAGLESKSNAFSTFGDRVHAIMAKTPPADATAEERELADQMTEARAASTASFLGGEDYEVTYEREMTMEFAAFVLSGHLDFLATKGDVAVIDDAKTGFREVVQASENKQGRGYALLVWRNLGFESIFVNFTTRFGIERNPPAEYDFPKLLAAKEEIEKMVGEALEPDAKRTPGDGCTFCPAKGTHRCPETASLVPAFASTTPAFAPIDFKLATPEQQARLLDMAAVASSVIENIREQAKATLAEKPEAIPGWTLRDTGNARSVANAHAASEALTKTGLIDEVRIRGALEFSITKAEDIVYRAGKETNKKYTKENAKDAVAACLGDVIQSKPKAPTLVRSKDAPAIPDKEKEHK